MGGRKIVRKYLVHSPYKTIVKTSDKQPSYTACTLFKSPTLRDATLQEVLKKVSSECDCLCSLLPAPSVLRSSICLKQLQWDSVVEELRKCAPVLLSILTAVATGGSGGSTRVPPSCVIGMVFATLLKAHSKKITSDDWCFNLCWTCIKTGTLLFIDSLVCVLFFYT